MNEGTIIGFGVSGGELCCLLGERQDTSRWTQEACYKRVGE